MNSSLSGVRDSSTPLGMTTGADRNAGSTFLRMILLSPNGNLTASPAEKPIKSADGISQKRIGNALVPVAGRIFREGKTERGFSRGSGSGERRPPPFFHHPAQKTVTH